MGYLDSSGLSHFWAKIKTVLSGKQDSLTIGDGLSLNGNTIGVTDPVKGLTKAEYDALTDEEKSSGLYVITDVEPQALAAGATFTPSVSESGELSWTNDGGLPNPEPVNIKGEKGEAGPDGNPIGTIISHMGLTAPKDYLICDGSVYNIANYQKLADFFKEQFGTSNYFGGNGTTTFAVPDMRNLFLRGFHGTSTEQLSGDVGVKQEATEIPSIITSYEGENYCCFTARVNANDKSKTKINNPDSKIGTNTHSFQAISSKVWNDNTNSPTYTARPVNMAVLYCIKATVAESYENVYSAEETRIGTWIDGKPLYRISFVGKTPSSINTWGTIGTILNVDNYVSMIGGVRGGNGNYTPCNYLTSLDTETWNLYKMSISPSGDVMVNVSSEACMNCKVIITVKYTKTTDSAAAAQSMLLTSEVDSFETLSIASTASSAKLNL